MERLPHPKIDSSAIAWVWSFTKADGFVLLDLPPHALLTAMGGVWPQGNVAFLVQPASDWARLSRSLARPDAAAVFWPYNPSNAPGGCQGASKHVVGMSNWKESGFDFSNQNDTQMVGW
jgi:hypothetical protein